MARTKVNTAVRNAFGKVEGGQSDLEQVTLIIENEKGEKETVERAFHKNILALITQGMKKSAELEAFWKDNADALVFEFFGEDPFSGSTPADMLTGLRASPEMKVMYATFQTKHPKYAAAMTAAGKAEQLGKTEEGDKERAYAKELFATIRATANNQAIKVCRYYAEKHGKKQPADQRTQMDAQTMIEGWITDATEALKTKRGKFKEEGERATLKSAIEALRGVLVRRGAPTSFLGLEVPPTSVGAEGRKAGTVRTLSPEELAEEYPEAQATEE